MKNSHSNEKNERPQVRDGDLKVLLSCLFLKMEEETSNEISNIKFYKETIGRQRRIQKLLDALGWLLASRI